MFPAPFLHSFFMPKFIFPIKQRWISGHVYSISRFAAGVLCVKAEVERKLNNESDKTKPLIRCKVTLLNIYFDTPSHPTTVE